MNSNEQKTRFWFFIDMLWWFLFGSWFFHSLLVGTPAEPACWLVDLLILVAFITVLFPRSKLMSKWGTLLFCVAFALVMLWMAAGCGAVLGWLTVWCFTTDFWRVAPEHMKQAQASYPWLFWPFVGLFSLVGLCFGGAAIVGAIVGFFKR